MRPCAPRPPRVSPGPGTRPTPRAPTPRASNPCFRPRPATTITRRAATGPASRPARASAAARGARPAVPQRVLRPAELEGFSDRVSMPGGGRRPLRSGPGPATPARDPRPDGGRHLRPRPGDRTLDGRLPVRDRHPSSARVRGTRRAGASSPSATATRPRRRCRAAFRDRVREELARLRVVRASAVRAAVGG